MDVDDSEMNLANGGEGDKNNLRDILIVLDKWTRTCDMVLSSLDEQIKKINKGS